LGQPRSHRRRCHAKHCAATGHGAPGHCLRSCSQREPAGQARAMQREPAGQALAMRRWCRSCPQPQQQMQQRQQRRKSYAAIGGRMLTRRACGCIARQPYRQCRRAQRTRIRRHQRVRLTPQPKGARAAGLAFGGAWRPHRRHWRRAVRGDACGRRQPAQLLRRRAGAADRAGLVRVPPWQPPPSLARAATQPARSRRGTSGHHCARRGWLIHDHGRGDGRGGAHASPASRLDTPCHQQQQRCDPS